MGRIVLAAGLPEQYERLLKATGQQDTLLWQAEQAEFGATHADVGAYLLGLWGLPTPVVEAVALQHRPELCLAAGFSPLTAVHVANVFAHEKNGAPAEPSQIDMNYLARIGLAERVAEWREACFKEQP